MPQESPHVFSSPPHPPAPAALPDPILLFRHTLARRFLHVGLVFLVAFLAIGTLSFMIHREVARIKEARAERTWTITTLNTIAELTAEKSRAGTLKAQLTSLLPVALQVPTTVIPHFQNLASNNGITLTFQLERLRPETDEEPLGITFSLRTRGTADGTARFLADLEANKFIRAENWSLAPTGPLEYELVLAGVMYLARE